MTAALDMDKLRAAITAKKAAAEQPPGEPEALEYALAYAELGWPVLPVDPKTKRPLGGQGIDHATTDEATIRGWWKRWPHAGIGMHLAPAQLCAVDLDPRNGCMKTPADFPPTLVARTGGGGWHLLYRVPEGATLPGKLGPGVDLKNRGYIIVEPSGHPSGGCYQWEGGFDPRDAALVGLPEIAQLPSELLEQRAAAKADAPKRDDLDVLADDTITDLRSALAYGPMVKLADDRDTWVRVGHALVRYGEPGRELWEEWSQKSAKYDADDAERVWHSLTGERTDYGAVFAEAQRLGWKNPKAAPAIDESKVKSLHLTTDQANAARLAKHHGADLAHVGGHWYGFKGTHWAQGDAQATLFGMRLSKIIAGEIKELSERARRATEQAEREKLHKIAEALAKFGARAEDAGKISSALRLAAPLLQREAAEFDADPWLFNVQNGTLDLRSGQLRAHRRDDRITRLAPVAYTPGATCPRFEEFLAQVLPDPEVVAFVKRFLGYCLTGLTSEQVMLILWGEGSNGKSTLVKVLKSVLGPYAQPAPPHLLEASRGERHPTEIADLMGARVVFASETEEGARLREAFVKQVTGTEPLKARVMYGDFFEFSPTHKLLLSTNHKPLIIGSDYAIWRRLMLLPFMVKFGTPEEVAAGKCQGVKNTGLEAALLSELEGVLAWVVEGCLEYQRNGLRPPEAVLAATAAYRVDLDKLGAFLEERCDLDPAASTGAAGLYSAYMSWCRVSGHQVESQRSFGLRLTERGLRREKRRDGWHWCGIALKPEELGL